MRGGGRGGGRGPLRSFPMMASGVGGSRSGVIGVGRGVNHNGGGRPASYSAGNGRGSGGGGGGAGRGTRGAPNINNNNNIVHAQNGCGNGAKNNPDGVTSKDASSSKKSAVEEDSAETQNRWYNDVAV